MWKSMRATTREELETLSGELHDACKIDMDSARCDPASRTLTFDFEFADFEDRDFSLNLWPLFARWKVPVRRGTLVLHGVAKHEVRDGARIGGQTVRTVSFDPAARRVRVEMNQDGRILADVDAPDVRAEIAEPVVRKTPMTWLVIGECGEF